MNKTLLLILCDFLLLTLLALTRWEDATPPPPARTASTVAARVDGAGAATAEQDMVAVMQLSLEDEQARHDELAQNLAQTEIARAEAETSNARLAENLAQTQKTAAELDQSLKTTRASAEAERARNAQLARDLAAREVEAKQREEELTKVSAAEATARARVEQLAVTVGVAQRENQILEEQTVTLRAAVVAERTERQRVQETAAELAVGVGQMAQQTGALTKEIREARPINANTLFSDFIARRVRARFSGERTTFFGPVARSHDTHTVMVSDGRATYALLHVDDTPFNWQAPSQSDWDRLVLVLNREQGAVRPERLVFTSLDPRVVAVPLSEAEAARLGGEPYLLALDPFKFPEAVLISAGGQGYGELPFKVDPANAGYVKVDNRLVRRLFGDFSPSRGDLVLSKTGELLGVMVSPGTCALVTNFLPQRELTLGANLKAQPTSPTLNEVAKRYQLLAPGVK